MTTNFLNNVAVFGQEAFLGVPYTHTRVPVLGSWYYYSQETITLFNLSSGDMAASPFVNLRKATLSGLAIRCNSVPGTPGNLRAGVYADNGSMQPGALVADFGTITNAVGVRIWSPSLVLQPEIYWVVFVPQGSSAASTYDSALLPIGRNCTATQSVFSGLNSGWQQTGVSGALPSTWSGASGIFGLKYAAKFSA